MRIAAAVCWYDEPADALERLLRSLVDVVDTLVIADGRWLHFDDDDAPISSPPDQRDLVDRLCRSLFRRRWVGYTSMVAPWESQVQKRNVLYRAASTVADWTLVIDGDEYVEHHDRAGLRRELDATDTLTGCVGSRTIYGPQAPKGVALQPRLFSSGDGPLSVEGCHNGVRTAAGQWLTGDPHYVPVVPTVDVSAHLRLYHEQGANRPHEREMKDRRYRTARRRQRLEVWPSRASRA